MGAREGMYFDFLSSAFRSSPFSRAAFFLIFCLSAQHLLAQEPASPSQQPVPPAQATAPDSTKPKSDATSEISQQDSVATFKIRVNLVQVHVVVRDPYGKTIDNLKREDFLLYDQGKLQTITNFAVETPVSRRERSESLAKTQSESSDANAPALTKALPERFVALVFDDTHLTPQDAVFARSEADKFLDSLGATDRVAILTTSGKATQDFTGDKAVLHNAIKGIIPRALFAKDSTADCPDVTHYMADQIENRHDSQALQVVVEETVQCLFHGDESKQSQALGIAEGAVLRALNTGDTENQFTYRYLEDALRRISIMPGERIMVLVSPGFLITTTYLDESGIIDRANRAGVVINTLDARGLYTPDIMGDISKPYSDSFRTSGYKASYRVAEQHDNEFVLMDFALGTGGTFFHNSNDLQGGLKLAALAPEVSYVLAFSPQNRKMDGQYHLLRVELSKKNKYSIQARRGYYAPRKANDPQAVANEEIQDAIFSQEEINELPLDLQTQYFKGAADEVRLSVVSKLEIKGAHFRKADGRSIDDFTVATAVFDENGKYVTGVEKIVQMKLLDKTYDRLSHTGITVKSSFNVKPGRYLVRQVVRDSEGSQMAARNGAVEIPN